ncbi:protein of unknown function [Loktanella atrilutea]|uniref:GH25 family protein n=1 Tax=Loktanella atrilutea TaxID=366533 RepID=A0A1M4UDF3_LOKAT|nr:DUF4198 domain-containing protein [Loktanella atrilutea]SHE54775.1 protein of unknown function [Loktanella atrilutea]
MRRLTLMLALLASPVSAHEYWLQPLDYTVNPDATLMAQIVNGSDYVGQKLPYLPQRFVRFDDVVNGTASPVAGRTGDIPAVQIPNPPEGLNVLVYQAQNATVDYKDWDTFVRFTEHKDFPGILDRHRERGFAEEAFREVYSRYSKSLVAVGDGQGADQRDGLETEIVALTNPYADDLADGMKFQLWYGDAPRANVRFEVYDRSPDGTVTQTFLKTDDQGMVTVPVQPGYTYMADAVLIREPAADLAAETGALWETLWANMTWAVPD